MAVKKVEELEDPIITKYRPRDFGQIIGQDHMLPGLIADLESASRSRTFILSGPSGVAKTTTARIIADKIGCTAWGLKEVNSAEAGLAEDIRALLGSLDSLPMEGDSRCVIIDECQILNKTSWTMLLKPIEDSPAYITWIFCTTDATKIPATIMSRGTDYQFRSVKADTLAPWLSVVAKAEGIDIPDGGAAAIASYADGNVREGMKQLSKIRGANKLSDIMSMLYNYETEEVDFRGPVGDLVRVLARGPVAYDEARKILTKFEPGDVNSVRARSDAFIVRELKDASHERALWLMHVLDSLSQMGWPNAAHSGLAAVHLMVGRLLKTKKSEQ